MPIYRFICEDGHETEDIVPIGTEQITCQHIVPTSAVCPEPTDCGKIATKRVQTSMSAPQGGPTPKFYPGRH